MKPVSPELLAILASREFYSADLYTFSGGNLGPTPLRFCGGDTDLVCNGYTFPAGGETGPYFDRKDNKSKITWSLGTEVDTLCFDVLPGTAQIFSAPFAAACRYGLFDGATLLLERVFMPTYGDTRAGSVRMFFGRVAAIDIGRSIITFSINSHMELLNLQLPQNLYQPTCPNALGNRACGVVQSNFSFSTTVVSATQSAIVVDTPNTFPAGYYDQGMVTFTSGVLSGLSATTQTMPYGGATSTISLLAYTPRAPNVGDTLTVFAGCDKTLGANGCPKFNNTARYRAQPVVPQPATAS